MNENFEKFMKGLRMAFEAAPKLEGVSSIEWDITYHGDPSGSQKYVSDAVQNLMEELNMC